jgi:mRNA-degrading endonuclease YafQ of YafQ-DinJ toxin-antitoxin module
MSGSYGYSTLEFTERFLLDFSSRDFGAAGRQRILRALRLLESNERHPSLRVHELQGSLRGTWSASASDELRITFERLEGGRKRLLTCSRHYQ